MGGHFINIVNNNVKTSSLKTIANNVSFPSVHCPNFRVVEELSWMGIAFDMALLLRVSVLWASDMLVLLLTPNYHGHEFHLLSAWITAVRCHSACRDCHCRIAFWL